MLKFKKDQPVGLSALPEPEEDDYVTIRGTDRTITQAELDAQRAASIAFQKQQDNTINRLAKRILGLEEANRGLRKHARRVKRKLEKADKRGGTLAAQSISVADYSRAVQERNEASAAYVKMNAERDDLLSQKNDMDQRVRTLEGRVWALQDAIWWQNGGKKEYKKAYSTEAYKRRKEDIEDEIVCALTNYGDGMDM